MRRAKARYGKGGLTQIKLPLTKDASARVGWKEFV
jgi:hypothetical protein